MKTTANPKLKFIVIEGPDGAGKTSQLMLLKQSLEDAGVNVIVAREPGGTEIGQQLRTLFLDYQGRLAPLAEVLVLLAAKAQLLEEVIYPAYNAGTVVLMDRYTDSLIAYQGYGKGFGHYEISQIIAGAKLGFSPDLTIYIDTPLDMCLARLEERRKSGEVLSPLDAREREFHAKIHEAYQMFAKMGGGKKLSINGAKSIEDMHQEIFEQVFERMFPAVTA